MNSKAINNTIQTKKPLVIVIFSILFIILLISAYRAYQTEQDFKQTKVNLEAYAEKHSQMIDFFALKPTLKTQWTTYCHQAQGLNDILEAIQMYPAAKQVQMRRIMQKIAPRGFPYLKDCYRLGYLRDK